MNSRIFFTVLICLAFISLSSVVPIAAKDKVFTMPRAFHAKTYPARDAHDDEKVTLAIDPYDLPDKEYTVFKVDYLAKSVLPIHFVLSNDSDKSIILTQMNVLLITKKKIKLQPANAEDVYRRLAENKQRVDMPQRGPFGTKVKNNVPKDAMVEVPGAQFMANIVDARSSQSGFFFFDFEGIENPLAGARLVVTGIKNNDDKELFYFEIPLEKYLGYKPGDK
jgi:hypothetical protein